MALSCCVCERVGAIMILCLCFRHASPFGLYFSTLTMAKRKADTPHLFTAPARKPSQWRSRSPVRSPSHAAIPPKKSADKSTKFRDIAAVLMATTPDQLREQAHAQDLMFNYVYGKP